MNDDKGWVGEIFTESSKFREIEKKFSSIDFKKIRGPYGVYLRVITSASDKGRVQKYLNQNKIKNNWYEKRWMRSHDYREKFFGANKPPYHCGYCGKKLEKHHMQIDHIVPVSSVKRPGMGRMILRARKIADINDLKNLTASCRKCNQKKSDKLGVWVFRGILSQSKWYPKNQWILFCFRALFYGTIFLFLFYLGVTHPQVFKTLLR